MREGITVSNIKINNQIKFGELEFQLLPASSENILEADWSVDYNGIYEKNKFVIIDYEQSNSDLEINISNGIKIADGNYKQIDLALNISINPSYDNYSFISLNGFANLKLSVFDINFKTFEITSTSGNIDVQINKSVIQDDFRIDSTSGKIDLKLDHITFKNNFITTSLSGDQDFDIWNPKFESNSNFTASSTTGFVIIKWANHFNKSHNINILLQSDNAVSIKMWSPIEISRFDVFLETNVGTTRFSKQGGIFEEVEVNHYQSYNINWLDVDLCNITAISNSGEAWVYWVNCFKWARYCGGDFVPYYVNAYGDYVIHNNSVINNIELYNLKYIRLNTTTNLTLNFETLPVSSENLVYVDWDLTYEHAMGIGKGSINLVVSDLTEGNTLKVYINLDFELDRILPTFLHYNVTVFYHPNYTFNNYLI
ncbi:MAG: hypothetical protein ACFE9I_18480 [Candidatus Hermodarchaeota archaeon]